MSEKIIVGLDVGTDNTRVVVAQKDKKSGKVFIIGFGSAKTQGMRRGVVIDLEAVAKSVITAVEQAERTSGIPIEKAYVSIKGDHIVAEKSKAVVAVSRADEEISEEDVDRVLSSAEALSLPQNKEILHVIPCWFKVDNQDQIKDPVGMTGVRLEANVIVLEASVPYVKNLAKAISQAEIISKGLVFAPLAAANAVLDNRQKELGVAVVDIGAGATGISIFEEGSLIHSAVIPVGAAHVTNDIAIGLRISIDTAEQVKKDFGTARSINVNKKEKISIGGKPESVENFTVSRHYLAEIMEARLEEIFSLVNKELGKVGRKHLLPAGIVLVGGGAKTPEIIDLAKSVLGLPVDVGLPRQYSGIVDKIDDPSFATALGLINWAADKDENNGKNGAFIDSDMLKPLKKILKIFTP